jgi:hypothetical protein
MDECLCEQKRMRMTDMKRSDGSPCSVLVRQPDVVYHRFQIHSI